MDRVDLNCDAGETFVAQAADIESHLMPLISSCNVSCGAHSGTPETIEATVRLAVKHGVAIGAHPSYPDRVNGGRVSMQMPIEELSACISEQLIGLRERVRAHGGILRHVKPHGALYHDLAQRPTLAEPIIQTFVRFDPQLKLFGPADAPLASVAEAAGITYVHEVFADRRYAGPQQLCDRSEPSACLTSPADAVVQVKAFLQNHVVDTHDRKHPLSVDSICIHSDTHDAVGIGKAVRQFLDEQDIDVTHP